MEEYRQVKFEELSEDVKVPTKAWDLLEFKTAAAEEEGASPPTKALKNLVFSEVFVYLVQKNEGVIEGESIKITLPRGGGTIDLGKYVTNTKGSFFVGFDFPSFATASKKKVIFVSNTRKRRLEDKIVGAGCNQILDISTRFIKAMEAEGLKVNTTQERYLSVLGGTFLFSAQEDNDIHLAQVTFKNSAHAPLFCEEP